MMIRPSLPLLLTVAALTGAPALAQEGAHAPRAGAAPPSASLQVPPAPQSPTAPALSLEHRMLVRCSAAFARVAHRQALGEEWALAFPPLGERGREFFVRASARVIDEAGLDRAGLASAMLAEAQALGGPDEIGQIMPACLAMLENAGV